MKEVILVHDSGGLDAQEQLLVSVQYLLATLSLGR